MTESELLCNIKTTYRQILGDNLTGIYIHGSLAFGCFHWDTSDIDFIVVVKEDLALSAKTALITALLSFRVSLQSIRISDAICAALFKYTQSRVSERLK